MKNDYWKNRFIALEESRNKNSKQTYNQIAPAFDKAERQIQNQIDMWYQRFADNNGVSLQAARKLLTGDELKELKWDIQEYIKYGKENAFTAEWMTELENASAKYHISRLEALKLRTQQSLEVAFGNELDAVDGMLRHQFGDTYHHTCFELMRGYNVGWDIGQIDERRLSTILSNPWAADGKTFSDRIWQSKRQMVNDLHQQMTRACILGKAPDETIRSLTKYLKDKTKNARYQAGRLVMTESTWIGSVAQEHAFNDLDVEEFEVVATLDSHTSDICQDMDGQHYPMKLYEVGVTAPPFHCFCRSCTAPYFNDEFSLGERAARDADGKTYYVPSDMTYKAWKKSFVDGGDKGALIPVVDETTWTPRKTSSMKRDPANFRKTRVVEETVEKVSEEVIENVEESSTIELQELIHDTTNYKYATKVEYSRLAKQHAKNISSADKKQIQKHTKADGSPGGYVATHNYSSINSNMRGDGFSGNSLDADDVETIEAMRRAISQNTLDDDYVLTRYVNADYLSKMFGVKGAISKRGDLETLGNMFVEIANPYVRNNEIPRITKELQEWVGKSIKEKAFVSTSFIRDKNIMKDKAVLFEIHAPKGTQAYIPQNRKESECLLADGTEYVIEKIEFSELVRKWIITVKIL